MKYMNMYEGICILPQLDESDMCQLASAMALLACAGRKIPVHPS